MTDSIINFFHLTAAAIWIGGALFIHIVLNPAVSKIDPFQAGKLMGIVGKRFSISAWLSYIVLIITGLLKTPSDMLMDFGPDFGIYLSLKHTAIIIVLIIGIIIAALIVPKMTAAAPAPGENPNDTFIRKNKQLHTFSAINTVIGLIILLLSSFLW